MRWLLTSEDMKANITPPLEGEFEWKPERSEDGPITILASGANKTVYVYRNGIPIGRAEKVYDIVSPGTTIVVSGAPRFALRSRRLPNGSSRGVRNMTLIASLPLLIQ